MSSKWNWETAHLTPGAGIILLRKFDDQWKVLGLWKNGGYDITKGHVEDGDGYLETAIREAFEEANIDKINFCYGEKYYTADYLRIFLGTTTQDVLIKKNKEGFKEHDSYCWLTLEEMQKQTYDYLKPAIKWAKKEILNGNTI
jgi:8-oxo-dGTP pyrophosphatase MutT (NUDIX family)